MKQKKFGNKVQNWHRPPRKDDLSQSYLAKRHKDPLYHDNGEERHADVAKSDYQALWDLLRPGGCGNGLEWFCEVCGRAGDTCQFDFYENKDALQFINWFENLAYVNPIKQALEKVEDKLKLNHDKALLDVENPETNELIPELLFDYLKKEQLVSDHLDNLKEEIQEAIGDIENIRILLRYVEKLGNRKAVIPLSFFSPFWVRKPANWDGQSSLVEHLFCVYKVPGFLLAEWERRPADIRFKWIAWIILMGQGASLQRAAALFGWNIPGKFSHYLYQVPSELEPNSACVYAEVMRLNGSVVTHQRFAERHLLITDPTGLQQTAFKAFWDATLQWVIKNESHMSDDEANRILRWALHRYDESLQIDQEPFSWQGRTVRSALRLALDFEVYLGDRKKPQLHWGKYGWDYAIQTEENIEWVFTELTSSAELAEEGAAMRHCVRGYDQGCAEGRDAIISLKRNGERALTISVSPGTRMLRQKNGRRNRSATSEELEIVHEWLAYIRNL